MSENKFELAVIGGGPAGYVAAIRASQLGFKTALIEKRANLGGTCLNIGCIPSKALLASTEHFHFARERFAQHGIMASDLRVDIAAMMARKTGVVEGLARGIDQLIKKNKIERFRGTARLTGPHSLAVTLAEGQAVAIEAENVVLATGSVPVELPFMKFDGRKTLSSDEVIALESVPSSLLVVGGGAIGLELGSVWARLGAKVTVIEFLPRIAASCDPDVARHLRRALEKQGLIIHCDTQVQASEMTEHGVKIRALQSGKSVDFEAELVLVAVGRRPLVEGLGLETVGVQLSERGRIRVDQDWRTSVPSIRAIGDVIDGPMLAHKAEEEGAAVAERLAGKPGLVNHDTVPNVIYTSPEAAGVGLTEEQAEQRKIEVRIGKFSFAANGRALANDTAEGFAKIIADKKSDRVLGVHLLAGNASELIAEAVLLMEFGGSAEDLARTIHAHPTMSETLREAAMAVGGRAIHG